MCVACDDTPAETSARTYLQQRYGTTQFTIDQNRVAGARHRMLIRQAHRLFRLDVARVPPYRIVEDRFPDLLVARVIEAKIQRALNPVVVVQLGPAERERTTSPELAKKAVKDVEWCDVYLSVVLAADETPDDHLAPIREALRTVGETSKIRRWEVNFYNASAANEDVRYRPVVARGLMQQVTEHRPNAERIDHRWHGQKPTTDAPLGEMERVDLVAARAANERSVQEIREEMKKIEQGRTGPVDPE